MLFSACTALLIRKTNPEQCPEAETDRVKAILREEMEGVARFSVPLTCEAKAGKNWAEAH